MKVILHDVDDELDFIRASRMIEIMTANGYASCAFSYNRPDRRVYFAETLKTETVTIRREPRR